MARFEDPVVIISARFHHISAELGIILIKNGFERVEPGPGRGHTVGRCDGNRVRIEPVLLKSAPLCSIIDAQSAWDELACLS